jgi:Fe-S cluster assembly iron-binding protein IscA
MANDVTITAKNRIKNIVINTAPKNRISLSKGGGGGTSGASYLTQLKDVDATDIDNNETVVYDQTAGKFVIKELPIVNGGEF